MKKYLIVLLLLVLPLFAFAQGFDHDLFYGLKANEEVKELQELLTDKGFYSGPITGNFFSLTVTGVKKFQAVYGITPTSGYFGSKSRAKANELLAASGITKTEIVSEEGVVSVPVITPSKTTADIASSLADQIKLLQQQLALLQQSQTTLQQQNQQLTQQTQVIQQQSQTLQQIQQQIAQPIPQQPVTSEPKIEPKPVASSSVSNDPIPTEISIQNQVCNLSQSNLKTEYQLYDLLQNGNTDGRIFMNAYILNQHDQNYYNNNPTSVMTITTSNGSNDKVLNGSGNTGPCGYHYPYQFYVIEKGTYTITYSALGLSKSITITVK